MMRVTPAAGSCPSLLQDRDCGGDQGQEPAQALRSYPSDGRAIGKNPVELRENCRAEILHEHADPAAVPAKRGISAMAPTCAYGIAMPCAMVMNVPGMNKRQRRHPTGGQHQGCPDTLANASKPPAMIIASLDTRWPTMRVEMKLPVKNPIGNSRK